MCWLFFLLGSITVVIAQFVVKGKIDVKEHYMDSGKQELDLKKMKTVLWWLNIITFVSALHDFYLISKIFGGFSTAILLGNVLYRYRINEGLPGSIPYISSLVFTAAVLAGNYTARRGRLTFVAVLPIIIIIMIDFANMGRADILVVALLFSGAYLLTPKVENTNQKKFVFKMRQFAAALCIVVIIVSGAEIIRSTRQMKEQFTGATKGLQKLSAGSIITPSIYLYFTSSYGVLNQYFKNESEHTPFGGHTFLPVYRILEKIGVEIHAEVYQTWYRTPVRINTGTYLRELHGDFGVAGLILGPYLIGLFASIFWFRFREHGMITDLCIVSFFYGIIGMSFFVMATRIGPFFFFLFVSILVGSILDKKKYLPT